MNPTPQLAARREDDPARLPAGVSLAVLKDPSGIVPDGIAALQVHLPPHFVPETMTGFFESLGSHGSWQRGFMGLAPLELEFDLSPEEFNQQFTAKVESLLKSALPAGGNSVDLRLQDIRARMLAENETHFVSSVLSAFRQWNDQGGGVVLCDLDETLIGSQSKVRFLRPSSEVVLRYAHLRFPRLQLGILTTLRPYALLSALRVLADTMEIPLGSMSPDHLFSIGRTLDAFEGVAWETIQRALQLAQLPNGPSGPFENWPLDPSVVSRVNAVRALRDTGIIAYVVDNDLVASLDANYDCDPPLSEEARNWLRQMIGEYATGGAYWCPQPTEEFIFSLLESRTRWMQSPTT